MTKSKPKKTATKFFFFDSVGKKNFFKLKIAPSSKKQKKTIRKGFQKTSAEDRQCKFNKKNLTKISNVILNVKGLRKFDSKLSSFFSLFC